MMGGGDSQFSEVGRSPPRLEARRKVTGRTDYVHNLSVPGMLHAKVFRSTVSHGLIRSIEVTDALAVPGVHYVLTGEDIRAIFPNPYFGPAFHDQPVLALEKVRYVGEPVAAVLAETPFAAAAAVERIGTEYQQLEPVYDEVEAMTSEAIVHEQLKPAGTFPDLKHLAGRRHTNIALDYRMRRGDVDAAFSSAAHVFEHEFRTQQVMHVPLEPMVSLAIPDHDRLVIHTSSQSPSFVRAEIARLLGWPENRVQVKVPHLGGGFGAKLYIKLEALVACAALIARAPVKLSLTMEEQFYTITRHATTFRMRTAVNADGRITARRCEVFWNGGAYADIGPRVTQKSGFTAPGPYDIENVSIDSYALYTNRPPAGAMRGFGIPQMVWAYESQSDLIARGIGINPLEFRRRNILRDGRPQATGTPTTDAEIGAVLETIASRLEWDKPFDHGTGTVRRGRGLAVGFKASIAPTTSVAIVTISADGSASLAISTVDMGQGSDTAMAQIVAETLGIATEEVTVIHPDTDATPYDMGTLGSRSTFHTGNAVKLAAEHARAQLVALAVEVGMPPQNSYAPAEIFLKRYGMQAGTIVGTGAFIPEYQSPDDNGQSPAITPFWMIGGAGVELEVDTETGHVRLTRLINAVDCGRPLNPRIVETQLSGAAIMQLGFTLSENMEFDAGQVTNASLADYRIPGIHDIPSDIENHIVTAEQRDGPYGAKGVGESAAFGISPAIANAIEDAVGVRITDLPLTPEKVLRALRAAAGNALKD
jgi:CO/xanthine dehydrogenase Mo-binding subunit